MASDVETYLRELQAILVAAKADPALVQDALFDAEEHLRAEMAARNQGRTDEAALSEDERGALFAAVVEEYGTPEEVASAYAGAVPRQQAAETSNPSETQVPSQETREQDGDRCPACGAATRPDQVFCVACGARIQARAPISTEPGSPEASQLPTGVQMGMQAAAGPPKTEVWRQIFGPFADGRVWTSLVYMILSLATGIAYFTIVVTGLSTAGGMMILIIGIPLLMLVLAVIRGTALLEGRLVEGLLGIRMPRRLRPAPPNAGFFKLMGFWLKDGRTWASMVYMVLMLPLGIAYFTIAVTGLSVGLSLATAPLWGWFAWYYGEHTFVWNGVTYDSWPLWAIPIAFVVGVALLIGFMHLVKWIGRGHAAFAKAMLVRLN